MTSSSERNAELQALKRVEERLLSTPYSDLPKVLQALLPKLFRLMLDPFLEPAVQQVIEEINKRVIAQNILHVLPTEELFTLYYELINQDLNSIGFVEENPSKSVLKLIDLAMQSSQLALVEQAKVNVMKVIIKSVGVLPIYSYESNTICYHSLKFLAFIKQIEELEIDKEKSVNIIYDFILDIILTQKELERNAVGSIQPGLSFDRVNRLTEKKPKWTSLDLKQSKLMILNDCISGSSFGNTISIVLSVLLAVDFDIEIAANAAHKMNGAFDLFPIADAKSFEIILDKLLALCVIHSPHDKGLPYRTPLKVETQWHIMNWIFKKMKDYLITHSKMILLIMFQQIFNSSNQITSNKSILYSLRLSYELLTRFDDQSLQTSAVLYLQCCNKVFQTFSTTTISTTNSSLNNNDINQIQSRMFCYDIIMNISQRCSALLAKESQLVILLFNLLETEDTMATPKLYATLETLRSSFHGMQLTEKDETLSTDFYQELKSIIERASHSSDAKKRLLSVQWAHSIFYSETLFIDILIRLADDPIEYVANAASVELDHLYESIDNIELGTNSAFSMTILQQLLHTVPTDHPSLFNSIDNSLESNSPSLLKHSSAAIHVLRVTSKFLKYLIEIEGKDFFAVDLLKKSKLFGMKTITIEFCQRFYHRINSYTPSESPIIQSSISISDLLAMVREVIKLDSVTIQDVISCLLIPQTQSLQEINKLGNINQTTSLLHCDLPPLSFLISSSETEEGSYQKWKLFKIQSANDRDREVLIQIHKIRCAINLIRNIVIYLHVKTANDFSTLENGLSAIQEIRLILTQKLLSWLIIPEKDVRDQISQCLSILSSTTDSNYTAQTVRSLNLKINNSWTSLQPGQSSDLDTPADKENLIVSAGAMISYESLLQVVILKVNLYKTASKFVEANSWVNVSYTELHRFHIQLISSIKKALVAFQSVTEHVTSSESHRDSLSPVQIYYVLAVLESLNRSASYCNFNFEAMNNSIGGNSVLDLQSFNGKEMLSNCFQMNWTLFREAVSDKRSCFASSIDIGDILSLTSSFTMYDNRLVVAAIECLPTFLMCDQNTGVGQFEKILKVLESTIEDATATLDAIAEKMIGTNSITVYFAVSEALVRLSMKGFTNESSDISNSNDHKRNYLEYIRFELLAKLLKRSQKTDIPSSRHANQVSRNRKRVSFVCILVLIKELLSSMFELWVHSSNDDTLLNRIHYSKVMLSQTDVEDLLLRLLDGLKDPDLFIQDISCMTLCHLFNLAVQYQNYMRNYPMDEMTDDRFDYEQFIAKEVQNALCREKRTKLPVGYSYAGEQSGGTAAVESNRNENDHAPLGIDDNTPQTGENVAVDGLARAVANAAAELGTVERINDRNFESSEDANFGVYSIISKAAKKTGENAVVFAVLSLIRRDQSFGIGETSMNYEWYRPPTPTIDVSKIKYILPILFMARFDPVANVKDAMEKLWTAVVIKPGHSALLTTYCKEILKYATSHLESKASRERYAACESMEKFIPSQSWQDLKHFIPTLLLKGMNVLDDIREFVRVASIGLMKVVTDQIVRACKKDEYEEEVVVEAINMVLPILLEKGLIAPSAEARGFCLGLLQKIVQQAQHMLGKWLPPLISVLVESMSAMEPRTLQYMQFHTARLNISADELEALRLKISQTSPMQETLDACLQSLKSLSITVMAQESSIIGQIMQSLCTQLQSGVGLATRVAAAQSLQYIAEHYIVDAKGKASIALKTVMNCLLNSHMAASYKKSLLSCIGALCKIIDSDSLEDHCQYLLGLYRKQKTAGNVYYDENYYSNIAECLQQVISRGSDKLLDYELWTQLLANSYVGSFDFNKEAQLTWTNLWTDILSSSGAGDKKSAMRRSYPIIMEDAFNLLLDLSWNGRMQGVRIIQDILMNISLEVIDSPSSGFGWIVAALHQSLTLQLWNGQHMVLELLATISNSFKSHLDYSIGIDGGDDGLFTLSLEGGGQLDLNLFEINSCRKASIHPPSIVYRERLQQALHSSHHNLITPCSWKISGFSFVQMFLSECQRSDKSYVNHVAKSLASLPWTYISDQNVAIYLQVLPQFFKFAEIYPVHEELQGDNNSKPWNESKHSVTSALKATVVMKNRSTNSVFGSRYGVNSTSQKNISLRVAMGIHTSRDPSLNTSSQSNLERPSSAMNQLESDFKPSVEVEERKRMRIEDSTTDLIENTQMISENPSMVVQSIAAVSTERKSNDPVFRMWMIECIEKGWAYRFPVENQPQINEYLDLLLNWTVSALGNEINSDVWSIRRIAIQLAGSLSFKTILNLDQIRLVCKVLQRGMEDTKYVKVAVESIRSLEKLMSGVNQNMLVEQRRNGNVDPNALDVIECIRNIIRLASLSNQPTILEAIVKVQSIWLTIG